jgi:hypothetical protein
MPLAAARRCFAVDKARGLFHSGLMTERTSHMDQGQWTVLVTAASLEITNFTVPAKRSKTRA